MPFPVIDVINRVQKRLQDEVGFVYDPETELLPLLNNSTAEIVWRDPFASVYNQPFQMAAGVIQTIPADAVALVDVRMNLGVDGTTPGPVITKVPRDAMDADRPAWVQDIAGVAGAPAQVVHYIFDERDPRRFWIWPHFNSAWFAQIEYAQVPDDVTLADEYPLPAMYQPASEYYIISRALARRDKSMLEGKGEVLMALTKYYTEEFDKLMGYTVAAIGESIPRNAVNAR